ncbi:hypothetical protein [Acinetobacter sp. SFB]|uniref:hypothetical protein n=1 Tax=Acinetobacter sp. SFB TaxID=1805634 RepID=UPI000A52C1CA|nr:hypothetical protein [Acinetobacter sp. SFB]
MKLFFYPALIAFSSLVHADLVGLNSTELTDVTGQGGADLSWTLSLNHKYANDMLLQDISNKSKTMTQLTSADVNYVYQCTNDILCHVAISPNNHMESGNQKWLVFKKIQGTLQIDRFSLDGSTITNKDGNPQTAMQLSFYDIAPLKIRNLGFAGLSVESGAEGYLNSAVYGAEAGSFDKGSEKGFMGLNIHGNLHMSGDLKIFSYNCAGTSTSRC